MIKILDCTLRDGGYINNWHFGENVINSILVGLANSKVDIIECGYLTNKGLCTKDDSKFASVEEIENVIPQNNDAMFVCMVNCGDFDAHDLPVYSNGKLSGIRIAFHKDDLKKAEEFSIVAKEKGYKVFYQPMVTMSYSKEELSALFVSINRVKPYAAYVVDSFGAMNDSDICTLFKEFNAQLDENIIIGFHSHNNLQLAYSNALSFLSNAGSRNVILDSSVYGMGRGAGNLCTELITHYINTYYEQRYEEIPLLQIVDECLMPIYTFSPWGYSIPYYISASHNCHPNYASFLMNKQTISVKDINQIISKIPQKDKSFFSKDLIAKLYNDHQIFEYDDRLSIESLTSAFSKKKVYVIAPGRNLVRQSDRVLTKIKWERPLLVSVNFIPDNINPDFVFVGNSKRLQLIDRSKVGDGVQMITTSNLECDNSIMVNYSSLIDRNSEESDNSGIMCLRLLQKCGAKKVGLVGFDGFDVNNSLQYIDNDHVLNIEKQSMYDKTQHIKVQLKELSKTMKIEFITESLYDE